MDRRQAIKSAGLLFGGAAFSAISISSLTSCQSAATQAANVWQPSFLSVEQGKVLQTVADILIPRTDTPGALDAGVPEYVDMMLKDTMAEEEQQQVLAGFKGFLEQCKAAMGKAFSDCSAEEQLSFLQKLEKEAMDSKEPALITGMKDMIYRGFFTSEEGQELLGFEPVPGDYPGCIPLAECTDFSGRE